VLINELIAPVPSWGAALPGARAPWRTVTLSAVGHGETYAPTSSNGYAVAANARPQAVANGLPTNNLKQFVQMKTRVNVDGDGARGPEPEREQA
jgi:hypothetical protein